MRDRSSKAYASTVLYTFIAFRTSRRVPADARSAFSLEYRHPVAALSSPVGLGVGGTMQTATNQALPTHTCTTHPYDAQATPPCRCVRQWPSQAPQKLQDFEDCDYSVHAAEASVRHGAPACA